MARKSARPKPGRETPRNRAAAVKRAKGGKQRSTSKATRKASRGRVKPRSTGKKPGNVRATAVRGAVAGAIAAVTDRLPWTSGEPDAIQLLENDHRRLEDLLKRGEDTTEAAVKKRSELLDTITSEFTVHELIEEKVLYPALKAHPEARDIVLEGYQEHHVADVLVEELHALREDDERWGAKFKVLQESIQHHIEEEEGEMFRTARAVMSRDELRELGARMTTMKAKARKKEGGRSARRRL